jgi:hypothetical protein
MRFAPMLFFLILALLFPPSSNSHPSARLLKRKTREAEILRFETVISGKPVRGLAPGPSGSLWGLDGNGSLSLLLASERSWRSVPHGPKDPVGNFSHLVPWLGGVVLGSPYSGLIFQAGGKWSPLPLDAPALPRIHSLAVFQNHLWVVSAGGLHRFTPLERSKEDLPLPEGLLGAPAILAASPRSLALVSNHGGVALHKDGKWSLLVAGEIAPSQKIKTAFNNGTTLWFGGPGQLQEVDLDSGQVTDLLAKNPDLGHPVVSDLTQRKQELWVATLGQGLFIRRKGSWEQRLPPFDFLPSSMIRALTTQGEDQVWVATSKGLSNIRVEKQVKTANVKAWYPKTDVPNETDVSRTKPEPRQIFAVEEAGGELSPLAALGDILFEDPEILGERAKRMGISCGTCHPRGHMNTNFFIPSVSTFRGGVDLTNRHFASRSHNGKLDPVVIPSLRGLRHTAPYGRTQQAPDIRSFTRNVIVLEFEGKEPDARTLDALTAYQREFDFLPTRWIADDGTLSGKAPKKVKRGEKLFKQNFSRLPGGSCASCHPPQSYFTDGRMHDIGTGGGFDVPSLRNANYSQPYMHDGRFKSYRKVLDHFNERYQLQLTSSQKADLEAYLKAVGEGIDPYR